MPSPNRRDKKDVRSQWQDDPPARGDIYDQGRWHAPRGYNDDLWMLARLFEVSAVAHGQSLSEGLPLLHDIIHETVQPDTNRTGWMFLTAENIYVYWRRYSSRKPDSFSYARHWADLYPQIRDEIMDQPSATALTRLEEHEAIVRERVESGEIDIIRRQK